MLWRPNYFYTICISVIISFFLSWILIKLFMKMSGCLRNDVFVHSQVTILEGEPRRPLLEEESQREKTGSG